MVKLLTSSINTLDLYLNSEICQISLLEIQNTFTHVLLQFYSLNTTLGHKFLRSSLYFKIWLILKFVLVTKHQMFLIHYDINNSNINDLFRNPYTNDITINNVITVPSQQWKIPEQVSCNNEDVIIIF